MSAKDADVTARSKVERLNCHGQPLSVVKREEMEAAEREMRMKRTTERMVLDGKEQHGKLMRYISFLFLIMLFAPLQIWRTPSLFLLPSTTFRSRLQMIFIFRQSLLLVSFH